MSWASKDACLRFDGGMPALHQLGISLGRGCSRGRFGTRCEQVGIPLGDAPDGKSNQSALGEDLRLAMEVVYAASCLRLSQGFRDFVLSRPAR